MLKVAIYNKIHRRISQGLFQELCMSAYDILLREKIFSTESNYKIELTFVGSDEIRKLNRMYHKKDKPTDVIALSFFEKGVADSFAGEIFICVPYARNQALKIGQSLRKELKFLFVHGLLHIFGYDHKKSREEKMMKKLAYEILGRK